MMPPWGLGLALVAIAAASCGRTVVNEAGANTAGGGNPGGGGTGGSRAETTSTSATTSSSHTSTQSSTQTTSTSSTGGCAGTGEPCGDCLASQCSALWCACSQSLECTDLVQCLDSCGGPACRQSCLESSVDGIADATLLSDCAATSCSGVCPAGHELNDCQKCRWTSCGDEMATCWASPDCHALFQCIRDCGPQNAPCAGECAGAYPDGLLDLSDVMSCTQQECTAQCS